MRSHTTNRLCYLTWLTHFHQQNPIFCKKIKEFIWIIQKLRIFYFLGLYLGWSFSLLSPHPCPDCGAPPMLGTDQGPVSPPGPSALSQQLHGRFVPRSPRSCQAKPKPCPGLGPSPGRRLMPKDGCPSAPSCLHLAEVAEQVLVLMLCLNRPPWAAPSSCRVWALADSGE